MVTKVSNALTRAVNGEIGTAIARLIMYFSIPVLTVMGFLIHEWIAQPVAALDSRMMLLEQTLPAVVTTQHQDEVTIGVIQNSLGLDRADRLAASDDTKAAITMLSAKTDQLQSSMSTITASLSGVAATLDAMKDHTVASNRP